MGQTALRNKKRVPQFKDESLKGFTLVEVMIALVVLLLVFLALMQTALVSIDSNMRNVIRDEAINIAEIRMNDARNMEWAGLGTADLPDETVPLRRISFTYTTRRTVQDIDLDHKQITITVNWTWKGVPYTHSVLTVVRRRT